MLSFSTYITEAFNTKVKWKQTQSNDFRDRFTSKVSDKTIELTYMWEMTPNAPKTRVNIIFSTRGGSDLAGSDKITGTGNQMQIFGAVINHIKEWVNKNPKVFFISFTASKNEDEGPSRANLYSRLVKRFASKMGFSFEEVDAGNIVLYILKRPEK